MAAPATDAQPDASAAHYTSWRPDEDATLRRLVDAGWDDQPIAAQLGRTVEATKQRRKNLGMLRTVPTCFDWPDSALAMLRELCAAGHSAAVIAAEINLAHPGANLTRSAVLGKTNRLGLSGATSSSVTRKARLAAAADQTRARAAAETVSVRAGGVTLLDLKHRDCRWPLGEPCGAETRFCGDLAEEGQPYCRAHARQAYSSHQKAPAPGPDFPHEARASSGRDRAVAR